MENEKNVRHIQMSNEIKFKPPGNLHDALVYAYLRSYMNNKTKECFPSFRKLSADTGLTVNTIQKSVASLSAQNLILVDKKGKYNIYKFPDISLNSFEPFSYEFLSSLKITPKLKGYWLLLQRYTFKDDGSGYAKTTYTDKELSNILSIPLRTIKLYNQELRNSGVLTVTPTKIKDSNGDSRYMKLFNLVEISQDMFFVKEKLQEHDEDIDSIKKTMKLMQEEIERLKSIKRSIGISID